MENTLTAEATILIDAPRERVWEALVSPAAIKQYMFGTEVVSRWTVGSPITWKGEWQGRAYEDRGKILKAEPGRMLRYSHFSPLTGQPDLPENYHTVTVELRGEGKQTRVTLAQGNNSSEEAREHSRKNWEMMLESLKEFVEKRPFNK